MSTHARRAHAAELLAPALVVVDSSRAAAPPLPPPAVDAAHAGGSRSRCKTACTSPAVLTTAWNLINGMLGASFVSIVRRDDEHNGDHLISFDLLASLFSKLNRDSLSVMSQQAL
jgi:hypothetical protein